MNLTEISSVAVWKTRDRNFWIFALLAVFTGLFGFDHFYLRSFKTGFLKIALNVLLLGSWYVWDVAQLVSDYNDVQENGLRIPMATNERVGAGVISSPTATSEPSQWNPPSVSLLIYALLVIMPLTGFLGIDRIYAGSWLTGILKFMFNVIFLGAWYFYDIYNVVIREEGIVKEGLYNPPPIGGRTAVGSFLPVSASDKPKTLWGRIKGFFTSILSISDLAQTVLSVAPAPIPQTVAAAKETVDNVVQTAEQLSAIAEKGGRLLKKTADMGPEVLDALTNQVQKTAAIVTSEAMAGGARTQKISTGGIVALVVLTVLAISGLYQIVKLLTEDKNPYEIPDQETVTLRRLSTINQNCTDRL